MAESEPARLSPDETERVRTRVRLMVQIASQEPSRLVAQGLDGDEWRDLVTRLAVPRAAGEPAIAS